VRRAFLGIALFWLCAAGCQQPETIPEITWFTTDISRRKEYTQTPPPDLASIPRGIDVTFSENPVKKKGPFPPFPSNGEWYFDRAYAVSVTSATGDVRMERWGVVERYGRKVRHAEFSPQDFAEAFGCRDGVMKAGQQYTFDMAHEIGSLPGTVRWYFIGVDKSGHHETGEASVQSAADDPHR
jgi:hypothetical protein